MTGPVCREDYPLTTVLAANLVSLLIWGIGAFILLEIGMVFAILYIGYVLFLEIRLIGGHCRDCYYYGRTCAFGRGRLSSRFFPKGDPECFSRVQITGKDILPDFLTFIIPVLAGILLLTNTFSLTILILVIILLLLGFAGNALVRGQLACRYCRQREIGCPAELLFHPAGKS